MIEPKIFFLRDVIKKYFKSTCSTCIFSFLNRQYATVTGQCETPMIMVQIYGAIYKCLIIKSN